MKEKTKKEFIINLNCSCPKTNVEYKKISFNVNIEEGGMSGFLEHIGHIVKAVLEDMQKDKSVKQKEGSKNEKKH